MRSRTSACKGALFNSRFLMSSFKTHRQAESISQYNTVLKAEFRAKEKPPMPAKGVQHWQLSGCHLP